MLLEMRRPKVSVVAAVYNTSEYLDKCLTQLRNQTMDKEEYEIIIVNDCSTDSSAEILDRFAETNSNVTVIHKKINEGTFWCRVDGMAAAKGEYIGFVDSDDWIDADMYSNLVKAAQEQACDIVECGYRDDGTENCEPHFQLEEGHYTRRQIVSLFVRRRLNASLWMRLYKRKLIEKVLNDTVSLFKREDYRGIRNEDEFLFPLLLNEVESYYAVNLTPYHYRIDSNGSIMGEIETDRRKKLFHAETLIHAGQVLLKKTDGMKELWPYYLFLQTDNLFYLLGIIKKNSYELEDYKRAFDDHFKYSLKWNGMFNKNLIFGIKVFGRNLKLYICYKKLAGDKL